MLLQITTLPQAVLIYMIKNQVPYLFTGDVDVVNAMQSILTITMVFSVLDTQQATLTGIIGAAGKQAVAAPLIVVCYWVIGVPLGIGLAFGKLTNHRDGLHGLWIGM